LKISDLRCQIDASDSAIFNLKSEIFNQPSAINLQSEIFNLQSP